MLNSYTKEIFRPECNPCIQSLNCIAHLDEDIRDVLPYLNTVFGGFECSQENQPFITFKTHGRLITDRPREIAINALKDEEEADKVLGWLKREINETWEKRAEIKPSYKAMPKPKLLEILKLLPQTNCRECGEPTCMVFAMRVGEGEIGPEDCPPLDNQHRKRLEEYMSQFRFDE